MYNDEITVTIPNLQSDSSGGFVSQNSQTFFIWGMVTPLETRYEKKQSQRGLGAVPLQRIRSIKVETWYRDDVTFGCYMMFMSVNYTVVDVQLYKSDGIVKFLCEIIG